jgi:hypothetical protein
MPPAPQHGELPGIDPRRAILAGVIHPNELFYLLVHLFRLWLAAT